MIAQLIRVVGTCERPTHVTGSIAHVGPKAAVAAALLVDESAEDVRDDVFEAAGQE